MSNLIYPNEKYDYITSLKMAHYFCEIGFQLLNVDKDKKNGDIYSFFVGASNVGIGIELYLKSFIAFSGTDAVPKTHKLKELYSQIDALIKENIKIICQEKNIFREDAKTFYIRGKVGNPTQTSPYIPSQSIEELLEKHNGLFTDFRYMFERGREHEEHFLLEYENLNIFVESLYKIAKDLLNEKQ